MSKMSATSRGFIIFGILVVAVAVLCVWLPFNFLPSRQIGVPMPVIALPGEVLAGNILDGVGIRGFDLTNTFTSLIMVDIILLLIAFAVWRATRGVAPDRFVPRGLTHFIELITEFLYNQATNLLGPRVGMVFPLAASIFLIILVANWVKLIPGYESVGIIACAEPGQPGYPIFGQDDNTPGILLKVDTADFAARAGTKATIENTHACEEAHPEFTPPLVEAKRARGEPIPGEEEHSEGDAEHTETEGEHPEGESTPEETPVASIAPASFVTVGSMNNQAAAEANPDLFVVIPFFRALATDLNFPLAMALVVVIMVQVWGVRVLGPSYFFKFINIPALGNISKNPMGAMDFVVGLVEIISELSRLVSLSFRLFGNIFAGGTLLIVMTFLVAGLLPVVFYFLEIFVGVIQAYVFSTLTVIYASQAITAHHGDDEHHDEEHAESGSH